MNWRRAIARGVSEMHALVRHASTAAPGFRVLMYHAVGSRISEDHLGIYTIAPTLFRAHVAALVAYPGMRLTGLREGLVGEGLRIAITFDDGYKDNLHVAAPLLLDHGIPFTVFISTEFVRNRDANYLSPEEVRELGALPGVTLGAHGATHVPLTQCGDEALRHELVASRGYLEDLLGKPVTVMSYPHGAVNRRVRDAVASSGYTLAACSRFDINAPGRDPLLLCRTDILGIDSVRVFRQKLHGDWDWYRRKNHDPELGISTPKITGMT
ncbi:MAG: polysaccharide deacetylase family protein [Betaproteobacteria bacterium]|nr:polysaccharide deacetylase family protein [Betaproteobacteria bacterium]